MKRFAFLYTVLIVCAGILVSCQSTQSTTGANNFKFNLQEGKIYDYSMDFDISQRGANENMTSKMMADYTMEVTEGTANTKTLKTTFQRMYMRMQMPERTVEMDSNKPVDTTLTLEQDPMNMMNRVFGALKGKSFVMHVNSAGEVTEVTGLREIAQAMVGEMGLPQTQQMIVAQVFDQQFNDQSIKDMFSQSFNIFPDKPIKVGDTWEKKMKMPMGTNQELTNQYTVKDIEGNLVTLDVVSKMSGDASGQQKGIMVVDAKTGLVMNATFDSDMGEVKSSGKITGKERQ